MAAKQGNAVLVVAVDAAAEALGLRPGLALADARARYPALDVVQADPAADAAMLAAIADWGRRYTPLVATDPPDGLFLDVAGAAHLLGGEETLAEDLVARLRVQGFSARYGLADTAGLAWGLARYGARPIAAAGEGEQALAPLPLSALRLAPETLAGLARLGLRHVGEILAAPRGPLARRFGLDLIHRLDEALGARGEALAPRLVAPPYLAERRLAEPILLEESVLAVLRSLALRLAGSLEANGEGGRLFALELFRVDGAVRRLEVATSRPLRDPARLARLFSERLAGLEDELDPGFGFDVVRLSCLTVEAIAPEAPRLDGAGDGAADLAALGDRLGARFGEDAVQRLVPADTHVPERAARARSLVETGTEAPWAGEPPLYADGLLRPLRLFSPPEPIEVTARIPEGPPRQFRWRRSSRRLVATEGPERIAPEWWRPGAPPETRDYYRVEDEAGRRYWIFREGLYASEPGSVRWFIHGVFA